MSKTKKIAVLVIIAMVLTMLPVQMFAASTNDRIYGEGRVETALEIADAGWSSATTAILAPADQANLVDALAAAGLAGQEEAPILLTFKNSLNADVKSKIQDLGVNKVYVVGAISDSVAEEVDAIENVSVEILKGSDRWATAKAINAKLSNPAGTFVVGYDAIPDALSVASYAAKNRFAIVLAGVDGKLPSGQATVGQKVYTVGGTKLVADISGATRLAGDNRFETNKVVAEKLNFSYSKIYVANGNAQHLVDALSVAPLAAQNSAFVALTNGTDVAAASVLNQKMNASTQVIALGGTGVVSDSTKGKIKYDVTDFVVESVKAINGSQLEIKFSKAVESNTLVLSNSLVPGVEINRLPLHGGAKDVDPATMFARLSSDGMTLTLGAAAGEYFDGTYSIYIPEGITSKTDAADLGAYRDQFTVDDKTDPEVQSVVYNAATDKIEVQMSEILDFDPIITVNNGSNVNALPDSMGTKYIFANSWDKGDTITVKVSGAVDYKGNEQAGVYTKDISITMDESALDVTSVTQSGSNEIKVVFNKAIAPAGSEAADETARENAVLGAITVFRAGVPVSVDGVDTDANDSSKRTYKVTLEDGNGPQYADIYNGKSTATLNVVIGEDELSDVYGNSNVEINKAVAMAKDVTGPQIVSIKRSTNKEQIIVRFDENVNEETAANLKVRKSGMDVTTDFGVITVGAPSDKEITFDYEDIIPNGTYIIRIEKDAISDEHGNNNVFQSKDITISDGESTISIAITNPGTNQYKVEFDGEVNNTAIDTNSYTINGSALPSGTDIYFEDNTKLAVIIELPSNSVNYNDDAAVLRVMKVQDSNGIKIDADQDTVAVVDNTMPTLLDASLAGNVLTLTFDENMAASTDSEDLDTLAELAADLEIKGGATPLSAGDGTINVSVDGKKVYVTVLNVGTSNWNTIKAYSSITVKSKANSTLLGDDGLDGYKQNSLKKDVTVSVTKK